MAKATYINTNKPKMAYMVYPILLISLIVILTNQTELYPLINAFMCLIFFNGIYYIFKDYRRKKEIERNQSNQSGAY